LGLKKERIKRGEKIKRKIYLGACPASAGGDFPSKLDKWMFLRLALWAIRTPIP